jgi:CheY-like chemotaxis protein
MMPEMDGIEAVRIIRTEIDSEYARTVPIIALTANAIEGNREMFLDSGFNDFISKPIDIKQLDMVLNSWIRDRQNETTLQEAAKTARDPGEGSGEPIPYIEPHRLLERRIEGLNLSAALDRYGGDGALFTPVLKSFITHCPSLFEEMPSLIEKDLPLYSVKVHGLKSSCTTIGAERAAGLALELEKASKAGNLDFVREHHGALETAVLPLIGEIKALFTEWEQSLPETAKEKRTAPDPALLTRLVRACAEFNSTEVEKIVAELEKYRYEKGEEFIKRIRVQADDIEYGDMQQQVTDYLKNEEG